eukprot:11322800-Alexandrium_andersonii.AAC.1
MGLLVDSLTGRETLPSEVANTWDTVRPAQPIARIHIVMHLAFPNLDSRLEGPLWVLDPCGKHARTKLTHRCCGLSYLNVGHHRKHIEDSLVG